jgi:hypothetical protein
VPVFRMSQHSGDCVAHNQQARVQRYCLLPLFVTYGRVGTYYVRVPTLLLLHM